MYNHFLCIQLSPKIQVPSQGAVDGFVVVLLADWAPFSTVGITTAAAVAGLAAALAVAVKLLLVTEAAGPGSFPPWAVAVALPLVASEALVIFEVVGVEAFAAFEVAEVEALEVAGLDSPRSWVLRKAAPSSKALLALMANWGLLRLL